MTQSGSPKYSYVNERGHETIGPLFDGADTFSGKRAAVLVGLDHDNTMKLLQQQRSGAPIGLWGFIDSTGTIVVDARFEEVKQFTSVASTFRR